MFHTKTNIMKKFLLISAMMGCLITDSFSQASFNTGALEVWINQYGRVRLFTPDGTRHLQRASILVGSAQDAVFDYTNDAEQNEPTVLVTSPLKSDYEIYGAYDNTYSNLPPNVIVKLNAYGWTNESFTILKFNVKSSETAAFMASVGLDIIPEINQTYGYDTVTYNSAAGVVRFHRGAQLNLGLKLLSAPLSAMNSFEWFDGYTEDTLYWNHMHMTPLQPQYASNTSDGPVTITAQAEQPLNPGESFNVYYAWAIGLTEQAMLANINAAVQKYNSLITSVEEPVVSKSGLDLRVSRNPVKESTTIHYQLPGSGQVSLNVYNMMGTEVATLVNAPQSKGFNSAEFNAASLPAGVYTCTLKFNDLTKSIKLMVVK